jgi:hypothetical protein
MVVNGLYVGFDVASVRYAGIKGEVLTAGLFGRARNDLLLWGEGTPGSSGALQDLQRKQQQQKQQQQCGGVEQMEVATAPSGASVAAVAVEVLGAAGGARTCGDVCANKNPEVGDVGTGYSSSSGLPRPGGPAVAAAAAAADVVKSDLGSDGVQGGADMVVDVAPVVSLEVPVGVKGGEGEEWKTGVGLRAVQRVELLGRQLQQQRV